MRVAFYDTRLTGDGNVALVREKAVDCGAGKITTPEDAADMARLMLHMDELAEEHCYMMAFNTAGRILGLFFLSKGTADACLLNPREIYIRALLAGASHIILLHNHPSGDVSPSRRDIKVTGAVREAGELIGVALADHIIIGRMDNNRCYFSFREAGMLDVSAEK